MLVIIMVSCVIFQTAVAIYLFNVNKTGNGFEKNLTRILIVLLVHLCTKFFLLVVLHNEMLYGRVAFGFGLAYGPLLFIISSYITKRPLTRHKSLLHLVPFFIAYLLYIALINAGLFGYVSNNFIINYTSYFQWLVVVSLLVYAALVKKNLAVFKKANAAASNALVQPQLQLVNNIATILAAGILTGIFFELTRFVKIPIRDFPLRVIPYICFAVIPVLILRYKLELKPGKMATETTDNSLKQAEKALENNQATPVAALLPVTAAIDTECMPLEAIAPAKRYEKSSLGAETMAGYEQALNKFVEKSKIFLNPELSLEELALQVKIPKHHLTQLLNDRIKKNFYAYINEYRITEAVQRLKNVKSEINIISLAYDCGFNSKSSFNNYFKKLTGYTPSVYRKMAESSSAKQGQLTA